MFASEVAGDTVAGLPKVVGLLGTLAVCAAALMGHLSPPELKTGAVGFWFLGLVTQALGLAMALSSAGLTSHQNARTGPIVRKPAAPERLNRFARRTLNP